jgi:hypothetical protein
MKLVSMARVDMWVRSNSDVAIIAIALMGLAIVFLQVAFGS